MSCMEGVRRQKRLRDGGLPSFCQNMIIWYISSLLNFSFKNSSVLYFLSTYVRKRKCFPSSLFENIFRDIRKSWIWLIVSFFLLPRVVFSASASLSHNIYSFFHFDHIITLFIDPVWLACILYFSRISLAYTV